MFTHRFLIHLWLSKLSISEVISEVISKVDVHTPALECLNLYLYIVPLRAGNLKNSCDPFNSCSHDAGDYCVRYCRLDLYFSFHFHFSREAEFVLEVMRRAELMDYVRYDASQLLEQGSIFSDVLLTEFLFSRVSKVKWVHLGPLESLDLR